MMFRVRILKHSTNRHDPTCLFCWTTPDRKKAGEMRLALETAWVHGAGEKPTSIVLDVITAQGVTDSTPADQCLGLEAAS